MYTRQQMAALAEKWLNGTISEAEKQAFEDWYNRRKPDEIIWLGNDTEEAVRIKIFESVKAQLEDTTIDEPIPPSFGWNRRKVIRWTVAATIPILIAGVLFFYQNNAPVGKHLSAVASDSIFSPLPPSGVKAMITLGDGRQIPLDSIATGSHIAQGAATISKKSNGELIYVSKDQPVHDVFNKIVVPRGSQIISVVLSDGTKVWMNVESSLQYPVAFTGNKRKVILTGEAYFEVSKQPGKSFMVQTASSVTEVLGTHFNVNSYDSSQLQVTLLEGAVKVKNDAAASPVLKPGEQAVVNPATIQIKHAPDLEAVMAWKNGLFKLQNAGIYTIMQQLAQWYDIEVVFKGNLQGKTFSGMISRNTQLTTVLEMLSMTKEVKFSTNKKTITVYPY